MAMEKIGFGFIISSFAVLTYLLLRAVIRGTPQLTQWPVALACAVAFAGLIVAVISIRGVPRWTRPILFLMLLAILTVELLFNPRCWVVLDPQQHGCHSTMIAIVLGAVGLALSRIKSD